MEIKNHEKSSGQKLTEFFCVSAIIAILIAAGLSLDNAMKISEKHMVPRRKTSTVFSKRSSTGLKKLIESGTAQIEEFDWTGKSLGIASYERYEDSRWDVNANHFEMTALKGRKIDGVDIEGSSEGLQVTPYIARKRENLKYEDLYGKSIMTQDVSLNIIGRTIEEEKKEIRNYASIITYSDGTTAVLSGIVSEAGNFEEIRGCTLFSPNGEVKGIGVSENDVVNSYGNGLITWSDKRFPLFGAHKLLLPDGTFLEMMYTCYDTDNTTWDYSYTASTGERVEFHAGRIIGYTDHDGKYRMPLDGIAIVNFYDEYGDVIGTKRYDSKEITWYDTTGEIIMTAAYDGSSCNKMYKNDDGTRVMISKDSIVTYYDADNTIVAYDYPNGYHINVSGKTLDIYFNGTLVKTITAKSNEEVFCSKDGEITIRNQETLEKLALIYGRNLFRITDDGRIESLSLEDILIVDEPRISKKTNVDKFGRVTRFPGSKGHV